MTSAGRLMRLRARAGTWMIRSLLLSVAVWLAAVLPETVSSGAVLIAERIGHAIAAIQVPHAASPTAEHLTASLGVASVNCRNFASPEEVVALADEQLYRAKSEGRNRFAAMDRTEGRVSM